MFSLGNVSRVAKNGARSVRVLPGQNLIVFGGFSEVEIACNDYRLIARHLADAFEQKSRAFGPRSLATMIEVRIEDKEALAGLQILKPRPRHDSRERSVPTGALDLRSFRQPER